jgi:osmotically inducible lipoprotein OsmB
MNRMKEKTMLRSLRTTTAVLGLLTLGACGTLTPSQQDTMAGTVAGAAAGTMSTVILGGCLPCGAAIGGAVGAGTGYAINQINKQIGQ